MGGGDKWETAPTKDSCKFATAATLVITPSHVIDQWHSELQKHFSPHLMNVVKVTVKREHDRVSYRDILNAQLVLISSQFVANKTFHVLHKEFARDEWFRLHGKDSKQSGVENTSIDRDENSDNLSRTSPCFTLFHWHRIILDEAPDYLINDRVRQKIFSLSSSFRWYLSGTPFPTRLAIAYCAQFLNISWVNVAPVQEPDDEAMPNEQPSESSDEEKYQPVDEHVDTTEGMLTPENVDQPLGHILHSILYKYLFSRHTKLSMGDDNFLPDVFEDVIWLEFSPIEKLFYDLVKSRRNTPFEDLKLERKLCAGLYSSFENSFMGRVNSSWNDKLPEDDNYFFFLLIELIGYYQETLTRLEHLLTTKLQYVRRQIKYKKELEQKKREFLEEGRKWSLAEAFPGMIRYKIHIILKKWQPKKKKNDLQ
ncbi:hypothetical protein RFI_11288 [Reticulomyxa filosa]|uniref:SNF2 N-terminal domain-containing protein n=1 Tax=Reticulomyxa filosa TaxID=46433 RepID=X6NJD7_RETFI|nr:hypothetical protein RFI_11288 [Reticulomyxa filosa]|eukprot:ETO25849.1 hypothetical protein RFI_11288 [Reticulomyxa filosa]